MSAQADFPASSKDVLHELTEYLICEQRVCQPIQRRKRTKRYPVQKCGQGSLQVHTISFGSSGALEIHLLNPLDAMGTDPAKWIGRERRVLQWQWSGTGQ